MGVHVNLAVAQEFKDAVRLYCAKPPAKRTCEKGVGLSVEAAVTTPPMVRSQSASRPSQSRDVVDLLMWTRNGLGGVHCCCDVAVVRWLSPVPILGDRSSMMLVCYSKSDVLLKNLESFR